MDMQIDFPGGMKVDAHFGGFTVKTDQTVKGGGEGAEPTPFMVFQASLGTCAGVYVLGFCRQRNIPTEGIRLIQKTTTNPETGMIEHLDIDVQLPAGFPEKYRDAVIRAASQCTVKKHLEKPPVIEVRTTMVG
jgi:putative redox protein